MAVGIQGEPGSNSARAVELFKGPTALECFRSFPEVFAAFGGSVEEAVVPLQNSIAGVIGEVADGLLAAQRLSIRAQVTLPIEFVVAVLPGHARSVRRVLAHPYAAAQCSKFLASMEWEVVPCHDTAGAARLVRESREGSIAALCPPLAAAMYSLEVTHVSCTDSANSATRFLLIDARPAAVDPADDRCFLALRPRGSLTRALGEFVSAGVEVLAVHSRPIAAVPFENELLLEASPGAQSAQVQAVLAKLGGSLRVLGSFTSGVR